MVLGCYYLTLVKADEVGTNKVFRDKDEAMMAYNDGVVGLHAPIRVRMTDSEGKSALVWCTVGFLIFNESIPQDLGFVDRSNPDNALKLEWCFDVKDPDKKIIESNDDIIQNKVGKKALGKIIERCIDTHGTSESSIVLDKVKATGFKFSTKGAITVAVIDAVIPQEKKEILANAEKQIDTITKNYRRGLISDDERSRHVIEIWNKATEDVADALKGNLDEFNPIYMMADSGARGSMSQIRQLAGMRGLIANTAGKVIEVPIRANYREGLNIWNTSFHHVVRVKVLPIQRFVPPTRVTLHVVLLTFHRMLSFVISTVVHTKVLKYLILKTVITCLNHLKNVLLAVSSWKMLFIPKQARLFALMTI